MNCSSCVTKKKEPKRAKNTSMMPTLAAVNRGFLKNWILSIGWSVCSSQATKDPITTAATAKAARMWALPHQLLGGGDVGEDRQRRGHDERPTDTHEGPGGGEDVGAAGEGGCHRAQPEYGEAPGQGGAAAETVGKASGGEEEAREDEHVRIHD